MTTFLQQALGNAECDHVVIGPDGRNYVVNECHEPTFFEQAKPWLLYGAGSILTIGAAMWALEAEARRRYR